MNTVWIVHPLTLDLLPAQRWGQIRFINSGYLEASFLAEHGKLPKDPAERILGAATEFDKLTDYVLFAGDHVQLMQFCFFLAEQGKEFQMLRWDRESEGYYPVKMQFSVRPYTLTQRDASARVVVGHNHP